MCLFWDVGRGGGGEGSWQRDETGREREKNTKQLVPKACAECVCSTKPAKCVTVEVCCLFCQVYSVYSAAGQKRCVCVCLQVHRWTRGSSQFEPRMSSTVGEKIHLLHLSLSFNAAHTFTLSRLPSLCIFRLSGGKGKAALCAGNAGTARADDDAAILALGPVVSQKHSVVLSVTFVGRYFVIQNI